MRLWLSKIASLLALAIGAMAVFAGGKVLLGILPDYYVIDWLPIYNFTLGIVSVFFSAVVIWRDSRWAMPAAMATLALHAIVMSVLQTGYRGVVAPDSVVAMTVRLIVWAVIVILLAFQNSTRIKSGGIV